MESQFTTMASEGARASRVGMLINKSTIENEKCLLNIPEGYESNNSYEVFD